MLCADDSMTHSQMLGFCADKFVHYTRPEGVCSVVHARCSSSVCRVQRDGGHPTIVRRWYGVRVMLRL